MRTTKDNVLLVTLKKNQHAPSLQFTAPTKVQCSRRTFVSAFLASINPRDGPPDRPAGRDANFLESSLKSTREAPFMQKIVLVCRPSGPSSVGYDQSPRGSPPWEINSTQCLASTDSKGLTSVIHLTGGELSSPDWCPGDALSHPRSSSSCSSSTSCSYAFWQKGPFAVFWGENAPADGYISGS